MSENNHFTEIGKTLYEYQQEGFLCDTVLLVEGNEYRAHSVVLAAASRFFKAVYLEHRRSGEYYIEMPGFDCDTVEVALGYIYTGRLQLPPIYKQTSQLTKLLTSLQQLGFDLKTFNGCQMTFKTSKEVLSPLDSTYKYSEEETGQKTTEREGFADCLDYNIDESIDPITVVKLEDSDQLLLQYERAASPAEDTASNGHPEAFDEFSLISKTEPDDEFDAVAVVDAKLKRKRRGLTLEEKIRLLKSKSGDEETLDQDDEMPEQRKRGLTLEEKIRLLKLKSGETLDEKINKSSDADFDSLLLDGSVPNSSGLSSFGRRLYKEYHPSTKKKPSRRLHLCSKCGKYFTAASLAAHAVVHSGLKPYSCQHCDKVFSYKKNLYRHSLLHRGAKPYLCEVCGAGFTQKANLESHVRSGLHGAQPAERSSQRRARPANEPGHYLCPMCEHEFSTSVSLKLHINRVHQSLLENYAKEDADSPDKIPSKLCDCCGRYFSSEASLKAHRWRTHKSKMIQCPICRKTFTCRALLITHSVVHTGEKPFACPKCDKRFRFKGAMRIHYRIHTGERPYKCEFCSRRFHQTSHLKRHRRTHTGEKPYGCEICKKTYKNRLDMRLHLMRVHQINLKRDNTAQPLDIIKQEFGVEEVFAVQGSSLEDGIVQALIVESEQTA